MLVEYAWPITVISVAVVLGKISPAAWDPDRRQRWPDLAAGRHGLAQIGEFSFIIATLGITLGVTSHFLYPVAVAVSRSPRC